MAATPYMVLTLPDPQVTLGPTWATELNTAFETIDTHDHSSGKGLQITPTGLNINQDLTFQSNRALALKVARFTSQSALLTDLTDVNQVYVKGGELYFQDASGTNVQITASGSVNIAGVGGITGLASTTAALTYSDLLKTFIFTQNSGISAKLDAGRITIRDEVSSANGVTLKSPSALGTNYTLTLPAALPASAYALSLTDTSGVQSYLTLGAANTVLRVNAGGTALEYHTVDTANITDSAVTTAKIADANVTTTKIADANVTTVKLADNAVTAAKLAAVNKVSVAAAGVSVSVVGGATVAIAPTITVSGLRPVLITITGPTGTANTGYIRAQANGSQVAGYFTLREVNAGTYLMSPQYSAVVGVGTFVDWGLSMTFVDFPAAGARRYDLGITNLFTSTTFSVTDVVMTVTEL